jgi:hypothetical protein
VSRQRRHRGAAMSEEATANRQVSISLPLKPQVTHMQNSRAGKSSRPYEKTDLRPGEKTFIMTERGSLKEAEPHEAQQHAARIGCRSRHDNQRKRQAAQGPNFLPSRDGNTHDDAGKLSRRRGLDDQSFHQSAQSLANRLMSGLQACPHVALQAWTKSAPL